jgi:hypothetical protein
MSEADKSHALTATPYQDTHLPDRPRQLPLSLQNIGYLSRLRSNLYCNGDGLTNYPMSFFSFIFLLERKMHQWHAMRVYDAENHNLQCCGRRH